MDRIEFLSVLVRLILDQRLTESPLKVDIDGRGAAGKSMLADELAAQMRERRYTSLSTIRM